MIKIVEWIHAEIYRVVQKVEHCFVYVMLTISSLVFKESEVHYGEVLHSIFFGRNLFNIIL